MEKGFTLTRDELLHLIKITEQFDTEIVVKQEGDSLWFYRKNDMSLIGAIDE